MTRQRLISVSERWFTLLLRLYPADFREEMGDCVVQTYRERAVEAANVGTGRLASVWIRALADALRNGLAERMRPAISWRRRGNWGRDLELARRRLLRAPIFVAATVATLTVGLGTFAVVLTAVDKILLEPLPYRDPGDLYTVWERARNDGSVLTGPAVAALQNAGGVIEAAAGLQVVSLTLPAGANSDALRITGVQATTNLFDLLGVRPALGRGFRPDETGPKSPNVLVLTDRLWKKLGGDPALVGRDITIGTTPFTVIGVMPPGFQFSAARTARPPDAYIPFYIDLAAEAPYLHDYLGVLRARHGASRDAVRNAVDTIGRRFSRLDSHQGSGSTLFPVGLQADIVAEVRPALLALSFAVVFLLLVMTVNLASLLLARAAAREREFAVSRALGASGPMVVRATVLEGALLGLSGGIVGALVGVYGTRLLVTLGPQDLARRDTIALDWHIGLIVVAVGVLLGLIAAVAPTAWASRMSLGSLLASSFVRGGAASGRLRRGLIVAQVALCLGLLSAAGVVARSFERLIAANPGFRSEGLVTFNVGLGSWLFPEDSDSAAFQGRVDDALRALSGVTAVSATTTLPLARGANVRVMSMPGAPGNTGNPDQDEVAIDRIVVRSGYFETVGMQVIEGRAFASRHSNGLREAVIDEHLASQFFPHGSPLGASIKSEKDLLTVIGVVRQARLYDLHQDGRPQLFVRADDYPGYRPSYYVIRTTGDPRALMLSIQNAVRQIDRRVPVSEMRTMDETVANRRSRERISAVLIACLALGALLLIAMGLFGVVAGSVSRRRGELAVRLALGATPQSVVRLVLGEGVLLVGLGLLLGIPGVYAAGKVIRALLIDEVSPWDPPTLTAVALGLALISLIACYLPARRVLRIDPAPLLRQH